MANPTMTLIGSNTVGSGGVSSVTFSSIPSTYTDLAVKFSTRTTTTGSVWTDLLIKLNGSTSGTSTIVLYGTGSTTGSGSFALLAPIQGEAQGTANTFGSGEFYIPNYASSNYKSLSADSVTENNASNSIAQLGASLWSNTAAINSVDISVYNGTNFVQYSTFYLYGISNS